MNTNKITVIGSIIVIILIISIPTIYKVVDMHQKNLYRVVEEKIIEKAKECYYTNVCKGPNITLEELYQNNYLEEMSNPVTKEVYNKNSYVKVEGNTFAFIVEE